MRGQRVILDSALADLYGVTTKRLNEQVKRNALRFPEDFMFQLEYRDVAELRSQFATSKGGRRYRPYAFTERGVVMAANVLSSDTAIKASILLVRAFVRVRGLLAEYVELKRRLETIEKRLAAGFKEHQQELLEIRYAISQLEQEPHRVKKRIGFEH